MHCPAVPPDNAKQRLASEHLFIDLAATGLADDPRGNQRRRNDALSVSSGGDVARTSAQHAWKSWCSRNRASGSNVCRCDGRCELASMRAPRMTRRSRKSYLLAVSA
jgi:hypothetical protein